MTDAKPARPRQVTLAGWTILVGSVLVVLFAFQQMSTLGSIEAQESAEKLVSEPPGSGLGLTADGVQSLLRVLCLVAGGAAAAAAVLGWHAMQRSRSARVALTLVAPVLLVAGLAPAGLVSMVVVGATVLLWTSPARDWFAGREPATRSAVTAVFGPQGGHAAGPPVGGSTRLPDYAPPPGAPAFEPVVAWPAAETGRPQAVVTACVVTIVTSAVTAMVMAAALLVMLTDRAGLEAQVAQEMAGKAAYDDLDTGLVVDLVVALVALFVLWALVAVVLGVLALRGSGVARTALVVSAFGAAGASLLGLLVVVPLLVGAAAVGVAVLLLRRDVAAWYAVRRRS